MTEIDLKPDITINCHGTIYTWRPDTEKGKEWVTRFFPDAIWHDNAVAVDHRMNEEPLIYAVLLSGLVLAGDNGIIDPQPFYEEFEPDQDEYDAMAEANGFNAYLHSIGEGPNY